MIKEEILSGVSQDANAGRMSESSAVSADTTMPKSTNSEGHKGNSDIANGESNNVNPSSHGNQGSNSVKA